MPSNSASQRSRIGSTIDLLTSQREDPRLVAALEEYLRLCESGAAPDVEAFAARFADIQDVLKRCLDGLQLMQHAVPQFESPGTGLPLGDLSNPSAMLPLGDFKIVREIGRGGMGIVYEARQLSLDRQVALKILPLASMLDPRRVQRFRNEAQAAAHLDHPNIVDIYGVGSDRGIHYYAMRYIHGCTLAELIARLRADERVAVAQVSQPAMPASELLSGSQSCPTGSSLEVEPLPRTVPLDTAPIAALSTIRTTKPQDFFRRVAELGIQAAEALEHAHLTGIVHRDIKPSNLMLDEQGKPWITDFGLARIDSDASLTRSGDLVGTLRYMSPEQAEGDAAVLDHRTDIYSLGIVLYELLTLHAAFSGRDQQTLLRQISEVDPPTPRTLNRAIPADLETIVLKSIAKSPGDRYRSAHELADDLSRFVARQPIQARPIGRLGRTWRWYKRSPVVAGLLTAVLFLSLSIAVTAVLFAFRETTHRQQAEATAKEALWQQYLSDMHTAMAAWEDSDVGRTLALLERHRPKPGEPDLRGFEWNYLWRQCHDDRLLVTINETDQVGGVAFSHDGRMLATGHVDDGLTRLWDTATGQLIHELDGQDQLMRVAFSPDDRILAVGGYPGSINLWDMVSYQVMRTLTGHDGVIRGDLVFSDDGTLLASGSDDQTVRIWDVATGSELTTIRPKIPDIRTPIFPRRPWTEQGLWAFARDGTLRLFDTNSGAELRMISRDELSWANKAQCAVSSNGKMAATAGRDRIIRLFSTEDERDLGSLGAHADTISSLVFAPNDRMLASSDIQGKVIVWNLDERQPLAVLRGHSGSVTPIAFSDDARCLVACGATDQKMRIWDITRQSSTADICHGHNSAVRFLAFSPDGRTLASGGCEPGGGLVLLWDVATGRLEYPLKDHTNWILNLAFSPDGTELASGDDAGTVRVWDLARRTVRMTIRREKEFLTLMSYSRDGSQLIIGETDGKLSVRDRNTGAEIRVAQLERWKGWWEGYRLSPDDRFLAADVDGAIELLDYPSLRIVRRFPDPSGVTSEVAFSPDGQSLAWATDKRVYLYSLRGEALGTLDHATQVLSVDFSPDGRTLATGDEAYQVHVWDVEHRDERATLRGHEQWVQEVRFSPDGKTIASASNDGTVRLWRSEPPD